MEIILESILTGVVSVDLTSALTRSTVLPARCFPANSPRRSMTFSDRCRSHRELLRGL
jgi:hypothetical protein